MGVGAGAPFFHTLSCILQSGSLSAHWNCCWTTHNPTQPNGIFATPVKGSSFSLSRTPCRRCIRCNKDRRQFSITQSELTPPII